MLRHKLDVGPEGGRWVCDSGGFAQRTLRILLLAATVVGPIILRERIAVHESAGNAAAATAAATAATIAARAIAVSDEPKSHWRLAGYKPLGPD